MHPSPRSNGTLSTSSSQNRQRNVETLVGCVGASNNNDHQCHHHRYKRPCWILTRLFALFVLVATSLRFLQLQGQVSHDLRRFDSKYIAKVVDVPKHATVLQPSNQTKTTVSSSNMARNESNSTVGSTSRTLATPGTVTKSNLSKSNVSSIFTRTKRTHELSHYLSSGDRLLEDIIPGYHEHDITKWRFPPPPCGFFKCFFPSQHYSELGYTIGQMKRRRISYTPEILFETYELVQNLSRQIDEHPYNLPPMMNLYHPEYPPMIVPYETSTFLYQYLKQQQQLARLINNGINNGTITIRVTQEEASEIDRSVTEEKSTSTRPQPKNQWSVRHTSNEADDGGDDENDDNGAGDEDDGAAEKIDNDSVLTTIKVPFQFRTMKLFKRDFYIQALLKIPFNSFLYYFETHKRLKEKNINVTMEWLESMDVLRERQHQSTNQSLSEREIALADIRYWRDFDETLYHYVNQTIVLLEMDPTLSTDFQIAIDPQGRVWHFDMDRGIGHDWFNQTDRKKRRRQMENRALRRIPRELQKWYDAVHEHVNGKIESLMPAEEREKHTAEEQYKEWKERMRNAERQKVK